MIIIAHCRRNTGSMKSCDQSPYGTYTTKLNHHAKSLEVNDVDTSKRDDSRRSG